MHIQALVCVRCGAPLPRVTLPATIECDFCGVVLSMASSATSIAREPSPDQVRDTNHAQQRKDFLELLAARLGAGVEPRAALLEASATHLGVGGRSETLATVVLALAQAFDREEGTATVREPAALARLAEAYLKATVELRHTKSTTMNLPFLSATPSGPKHLERNLTPAILEALVSGAVEITEVKRAPAPAAPDPVAPKPKSRWWPF